MSHEPAFKVVPIDRVEGLTPADFESRYSALRKPVVVAGGARTTFGQWSWDYLRSRLGAQQVLAWDLREPEHVPAAKKENPYLRGEQISLSMSELIDRSLAGGRLYLTQYNTPRLRDAFPALEAETLPPYFPAERLAYCNLWMGPERVTIGAHIDEFLDNFLCQVIGRKRFAIFPPTEALYLYPRSIFENNGRYLECPDLFDVSLERFPDVARATGYTGILEEGDMLFIPSFYIHQLSTITPGVSANYFWRAPEEFSRGTRPVFLLWSMLHDALNAASPYVRDVAASRIAAGLASGRYRSLSPTLPASVLPMVDRMFGAYRTVQGWRQALRRKVAK